MPRTSFSRPVSSNSISFGTTSHSTDATRKFFFSSMADLSRAICSSASHRRPRRMWTATSGPSSRRSWVLPSFSFRSAMRSSKAQSSLIWKMRPSLTPLIVTSLLPAVANPITPDCPYISFLLQAANSCSRGFLVPSGLLGRQFPGGHEQQGGEEQVERERRCEPFDGEIGPGQVRRLEQEVQGKRDA